MPSLQSAAAPVWSETKKLDTLKTHLDAEVAEQVQHVLIDVAHVFGVHSLHAWVEAPQVTEQELESVPQLREKNGQCESSEYGSGKISTDLCHVLTAPVPC